MDGHCSCSLRQDSEDSEKSSSPSLHLNNPLQMYNQLNLVYNDTNNSP